MKMIKKAILFSLIGTLLMIPFQAKAENDPVAYAQSCEAAHWSAYIPIAGLMAAAILFGVADESSADSSKSYETMGSGSKKHHKCRSCSCFSHSHSHSHQSR